MAAWALGQLLDRRLSPMRKNALLVLIIDILCLLCTNRIAKTRDTVILIFLLIYVYNCTYRLWQEAKLEVHTQIAQKELE